MSSYESDFLDDESDGNGYDSRSSGMCAFPLHFEESVGHVSVLGSGFFLIVGKYKCGIVPFVVFMSIRVYSKDGRLIETFSRSNSWFSLQISKSIL